MKIIQGYIKNIFLIVLSIIVLAGSSGLSYTAHYCNGNLSGIAFFTELGLQNPVSCGCNDDLSDGKHKSSTDSHELKKKSCCSNVSFFSKLNIESPSNYFSTLTLEQPACTIAELNDYQKLSVENEVIPVFENKFPPPLLAGRNLVLFLSQQRMPHSFYSC